MSKNETLYYKIGVLKAKRKIASLRLQSAQQEAKSLSFGDFYEILSLKSSINDCTPEEKGIRDAVTKRIVELNEIEENMKTLIFKIDEKISELQASKRR